MASDSVLIERVYNGFLATEGTPENWLPNGKRYVARDVNELAEVLIKHFEPEKHAAKCYDEIVP